METTTEKGMTPTVANIRAKLGQKAKLEPKFRFYTLYHLLGRTDVLMEAWKLVKRNGGAAGIDGISIRSIEESQQGVDGFLAEIRFELQSKTYYPKPVKRVYIPKSDGKLRPLGIPVIKDRVVQAAILLIIEPIFEQDFLDCSYGFRPGRSAHQAIDSIKRTISQGKVEVYDADLKGYFDSIPHDQLMKAVEMRIADQQILKVIRKWLQAPIWESGKPMVRNDQGTPQGGVISPILANIYLHWFDKAFHSPDGPGTWAQAVMVRYADDFVIMARYVTKKMTDWIEQQLEGRFKLTINKEKTKLVNLRPAGSSLDFLGFTMRHVFVRGECVKFCLITPSKKKLLKAKEVIREFTSSRNGYKPIQEVIGRLNRYLRGWGQYFSKGHPSKTFSAINGYVHERLYRFLQRRSQRGYKKPNTNQTWYEFIKNHGVLQLSKKNFQMKA